MASPEERLALPEQQLTVVTHQLLAMQLQSAQLAAAVCQQGAPQARVAPHHGDFNLGTTFSMPANFGDSEPEEKEGSATASDARPANRRSEKLRDRSLQRAERSAAAAAAEQESVSEGGTKGGTGANENARMCTHWRGIGLVTTDCWTKAAGEKAREGVNASDAGSTAQRAAGSAAAEPMQIAVEDLNAEGLFITALSVEVELTGSPARKDTA